MRFKSPHFENSCLFGSTGFAMKLFSHAKPPMEGGKKKEFPSAAGGEIFSPIDPQSPKILAGLCVPIFAAPES